MISKLVAIKVSIPPSNGFEDIAVQGTQHLQSNGDLVYNYVQLANQYLWFSIIVICFAAVIRLGFKLMTNPAGTDDGKTTLKDTILGLGAGLVVAMVSYTIVRLVINII